MMQKYDGIARILYKEQLVRRRIINMIYYEQQWNSQKIEDFKDFELLNKDWY